MWLTGNIVHNTPNVISRGTDNGRTDRHIFSPDSGISSHSFGRSYNQIRALILKLSSCMRCSHNMRSSNKMGIRNSHNWLMRTWELSKSNGSYPKRYVWSASIKHSQQGKPMTFYSSGIRVQDRIYQGYHYPYNPTIQYQIYDLVQHCQFGVHQSLVDPRQSPNALTVSHRLWTFLAYGNPWWNPFLTECKGTGSSGSVWSWRPTACGHQSQRGSSWFSWLDCGATASSVQSPNPLLP